MLDRDLAELYDVKTRRLRELVERNVDRFSSDFMFQLTEKKLSVWCRKMRYLQNNNLVVVFHIFLQSKELLVPCLISKTLLAGN